MSSSCSFTIIIVKFYVPHKFALKVDFLIVFLRFLSAPWKTASFVIMFANGIHLNYQISAAIMCLSACLVIVEALHLYTSVCSIRSRGGVVASTLARLLIRRFREGGRRDFDHIIQRVLNGLQNKGNIAICPNSLRRRRGPLSLLPRLCLHFGAVFPHCIS